MDGIESDYRQFIILLYFAFTSLTTVGFGDYYPKNSIERMIIAFALLFGVAIFSYMMGNFIQIIQSYNDYNKINDEEDSLSKFFGILRKFNRNELLDPKFERLLEKYFTYRWEKDKNDSLIKENYLYIVEQIPAQVVDSIYADFLFRDFLQQYRKFFQIPKQSVNLHSRYTWFDDSYRFFMLEILKNLEPRFEEKDTILIEELDEVNEIIFLEKGIFEVGYSVNK